MNKSLSDTTVKIKGLSPMTELDYLEYRYKQALAKLMLHPTLENMQAFEKVNKEFFETQDLYRIGARLLIAFHQKFTKGSQNLHRL